MSWQAGVAHGLKCKTSRCKANSRGSDSIEKHRRQGARGGGGEGGGGGGTSIVHCVLPAQRRSSHPDSALNQIVKRLAVPKSWIIGPVEGAVPSRAPECLPKSNAS